MPEDLRILPAEEGQQQTRKRYLQPEQRAKLERRLAEGMDESAHFPACTPEQRATLWTLLELKQAESTLSHIRQVAWNKTAEKLHDDDSSVFAAIWWKCDDPEKSGYEIHDCLYYEGGGEEPRQRIFADCDGDEFEPADVQFWIYKTDLAKTVPAYPELRALLGKE